MKIDKNELTLNKVTIARLDQKTIKGGTVTNPTMTDTSLALTCDTCVTPTKYDSMRCL